jgi:hypothetical protein
MHALGTHTEGATERPTIKLHNQLCPNPLQKPPTPSRLPPQLSIRRHGQASTRSSDESVIHNAVDNGAEFQMARTDGARRGCSNGVGDRVPARGMNDDRVSERGASGLSGSQADER